MLTKRWLILSLYLSFGVLLGVVSPPAKAHLRCESIFSSQGLNPGEIDTPTFDSLTNKLRDTLAGKLATVWRSEWKAKLNRLRSNEFVLALLQQFLSQESFNAAIGEGLDLNDPQFVSKVHRNLFNLKKMNAVSSEDHLTVRDESPPQGVRDSTFTFYTNSLKDGAGKHQIRVRTYLRQIEPEELDLQSPIKLVSLQGTEMNLTRMDQDHFQLDFSLGGETRSEQLTSVQLRQRFGTLVFHAPHGNSYKLEVKTALKDEIGSHGSPVLAGNHMVQKLDLKLSFRQMHELFQSFRGSSSEQVFHESMSRIEALRAELLQQPTDEKTRARIHAILEVLIEGVKSDSHFLVLAGATHYERSAFESSAGFQVTVDWNQLVYQGIYSSEPSGNLADARLMNPAEILQRGQRFIPPAQSERHVELKFPVHAVKDINGLKLYDPRSENLIPREMVDRESFGSALEIYAPYVTSNDHPGKFNFLRNNGLRETSIQFQGD